MPGPTTESLATDFRDVLREMTAARSEFALFREEFAGFRGRVETQLSIMKWIGGFVATVLVTLIGCGFWLAWEASALTQRVGSMEKSTAKVVEQVDVLEKTTAKVADRVDLLEKTTAKIVERLDQEFGPAKTKPLNR